MPTLASKAAINADDDTPEAGPIGALVIAIPISLLLWAAVAFALLNLIH